MANIEGKLSINDSLQGEQLSVNGGLRLGQRQKQPIVTFVSDDGKIEDWTKLKPIFENAEVPCVVALISSLIGESGSTSVAQNTYLQDTLGWEIASHTSTHVDLSELTIPEIDAECKNSRDELLALQYNVTNLVYPFGGNDSRVRKIARKYYRSGTKVAGGNNAGFLATYKLNRVALGSFFDAGYPFPTNDFNYYKSRIDEAVTDQSWVIFMMHPAEPEHDATQQQYLAETINYAKSINVPILTLEQALDRIGNIIDVGDYEGPESPDSADDYFLLDSAGKPFFVGSDNINIQTKSKDDAYTAASLLTDFGAGQLTYTKIGYSGCVGFPEDEPGYLITNNIPNESGFGRQQYQIYNKSRTYERYWTLDNIWSAWTTIPIRMPVVVQNMSFGTIGAQSTKELNVNVPGIEFSDSVIANPFAYLEPGLVWSVYMDYIDSVKIRIANVTTVPITVDDRDWSITVIKN